MADISGVDKSAPISGGGGVITPHDTNLLTYETRALWIGGAGAVAITTTNGDEIVLSGITAGTLLPIRAKRIKSTGTTATLIVGLW